MESDDVVMLGLEISKIATENIKAKYKARFRPHRNKKGYLFSHEDYGEGVFCSKEQYDSLVDEFNAFMERKSRFMFWWLVLMVTLGIGLGVVDIFYYKLDFLHYKIWDNSSIGIFLMLSPLLFFIPKGWRLYQKPLKLLRSDREFARSKRPREEIMDRRIKGISWEMIILGIIVSSIGIYFERTGSYDSPYLIYLFVGVLWMHLYFAWRKYKIYKREHKLC